MSHPQPGFDMSLTSDNVFSPPPEKVAEARRGQPRTRLLGLLLAVCGIQLMALAFGNGLSEARGGVFSGGARGENIRGSDAPDRISGLGGADTIMGLEGEDFMAGGGGNDELSGGSGHDVLLGGEGDDFTEARDGERDYVGCGPGRDTVSTDPVDRVSADCETVYTT